MTPEKAKAEPFDIHDESLLRWHVTNAAEQGFGFDRREAELLFREHHPRILKHLRNATTRSSQFAAIAIYLEDIL